MRRFITATAIVLYLASCAHTQAPPASAYRAPVGQCLTGLGTLLLEWLLGGAGGTGSGSKADVTDPTGGAAGADVKSATPEIP